MLKDKQFYLFVNSETMNFFFKLCFMKTINFYFRITLTIYFVNNFNLKFIYLFKYDNP